MTQVFDKLTRRIFIQTSAIAATAISRLGFAAVEVSRADAIKTIGEIVNQFTGKPWKLAGELFNGAAGRATLHKSTYSLHDLITFLSNPNDDFDKLRWCLSPEGRSHLAGALKLVGTDHKALQALIKSEAALEKVVGSANDSHLIGPGYDWEALENIYAKLSPKARESVHKEFAERMCSEASTLTNLLDVTRDNDRKNAPGDLRLLLSLIENPKLGREAILAHPRIALVKGFYEKLATGFADPLEMLQLAINQKIPVPAQTFDRLTDLCVTRQIEAASPPGTTVRRRTSRYSYDDRFNKFVTDSVKRGDVILTITPSTDKTRGHFPTVRVHSEICQRGIVLHVERPEVYWAFMREYNRNLFITRQIVIKIPHGTTTYETLYEAIGSKIDQEAGRHFVIPQHSGRSRRDFLSLKRMGPSALLALGGLALPTLSVRGLRQRRDEITLQE